MDRRQFLTTGLAVGGSATVAGCLDDVLGEDGDLGSRSSSFADVGNWLPEPKRIMASNAEGYSVEARSPARLLEVLGDLAVVGGFEPTVPFASPNGRKLPTSIEGSVTDGSFEVHVGEFNPEWTNEQLAATDDWQAERLRDGHGSYVHDNNRAAIVFSDGVYIRTQGADALGLAEEILDAESGDVTRYDEADDAMAEIENTLPFGHELSTETFAPRDNSFPESGAFENTIGYGVNETIHDDGTDETEVHVFLDEVDIREREIDEYIEESGEFSHYRDRPTVTIDGRVVIIEGTKRTIF